MIVLGFVGYVVVWFGIGCGEGFYFGVLDVVGLV